MQTILQKFNFSNFSKRNLVPKLLQQGRFSRTGFKMLGTNRKDSRNYEERGFQKSRRSVDLTNVHNSHLYFDRAAQTKLQYLRWKERQSVRKQMLVQAPSLSDVLAYIKNKEYLEQGDPKLLFGVKLLARHYSDQIPENMDHVMFALGRINKHIRNLDIFNFRSLVSFALRYSKDDEEVWRLYLQNTVRFILSYEQRQQPLLSNQVSSQIRDEFLTIFHTVVERALHFKFDLTHLITQLDIMMRNHYRSVPGLKQVPQHNDIQNLSGDRLAYFLSDFTRVMIQRQDFFSDYDRQKKEGQVKEIIQRGEEQLMEQRDQLSDSAIKLLRKTEAVLSGSPYETPVHQKIKQSLSI